MTEILNCPRCGSRTGCSTSGYFCISCDWREDGTTMTMKAYVPPCTCRKPCPQHGPPRTLEDAFSYAGSHPEAVTVLRSLQDWTQRECPLPGGDVLRWWSRDDGQYRGPSEIYRPFSDVSPEERATLKAEWRARFP